MDHSSFRNTPRVTLAEKMHPGKRVIPPCAYDADGWHFPGGDDPQKAVCNYCGEVLWDATPKAKPPYVPRGVR